MHSKFFTKKRFSTVIFFALLITALMASPVFAGNSIPLFKLFWGTSNPGGVPADGTFNEPSDIAVVATSDDTANIYVADTANHRVQVFTHNHTRIDADTDAVSFAAAIGPNFDKSGTGDTLMGPRGVAADNDGNIYIADSSHNRIVKFNAAGVFQAEMGSLGSAYDLGTGTVQFSDPRGLGIDSTNGFLYVADMNNDRVIKLNTSDLHIAAAPLGNPLNDPRDVAVSPTGDYIFVADTTNHRIAKILVSDNSQSTYGTLGTGGTNLSSPSGVAVDTSTPYNVYIADTNNNRIVKINPVDMTYLSRWGSSGASNIQFALPWGVTALGEDMVYTADTGNNRIKFYEFNVTPHELSLDTSHILEGSYPTETLIGTFTASDYNQADTAFTYAWVNDPGCDNGTFFNLDTGGSGAGQLTLQAGQVLDFETRSSYQVCVRARDGISTHWLPATGGQVFTITVDDGSDAPVITASGTASGTTDTYNSFLEYTVNPSNTTRPNKTLDSNSNTPPTITVLDSDVGDNMTFALTGGTFLNAFYIQKLTDVTADIKIRDNEEYKTLLNYEANTSGTLVVQATDTNDPPNTTTLTLTINLSNQNDWPILTVPGTPFTVEENVTTVIPLVGGAVTVTDQDTGNNLNLAFDPFPNTYFQAQEPTANNFNLATTGTPVDFETNPSFTLDLKARDGTSGSAGYDIKSVQINVINKNDAPVLAATYELPQSVALGTELYLATDQDTGDTLTYTILSGNEGSPATFDASTGKIVVNNKALITVPKTFNLEVQVQDSGTNPVHGPVTRIVQIVVVSNQAPTFNLNPVLTVPEMTTNEAFVVGTITGNDADGDTLHFSTSDSTGPFTVSDTGVVHVNAANAGVLNYETIKYYDLPVSVTDNANPAVDHTFRVNITNVNEAITITNKTLTINNLGDRTPVNTVIGTVTWTDIDANTVPTFTLTVDGTNQFGIKSNGDVYILPTASLHYNVDSSYTPVITITDKVGADATQDSFILPITLRDDNDAPAFVANIFTLSEDCVDDQVVGTFEVYDENGDEFNLSLSGDTGTFKLGTIVPSTRVENGVTVVVKTVQILVKDHTKVNYETAVNHKIPFTIIGTDTATNPLSRSNRYDITITNVNEAPVLNDQPMMTYQGVPGSTVIGTIAASDPDGNTTLTFIDSYPGDSGDTFFQLDPSSSTSGKIKVRVGAVPQAGTYTMRVRANDGALDSRVATITITVTSLADPAVDSLTLPASELLIGSSIQYNITVKNKDDGISSPYALRLKLPAGVGFVGAGSTTGCDYTTADTVSCPGIALNPMGSAGDSASFIVNAYVYLSVANNASLSTTATLVPSDPKNDNADTTNNQKTVNFFARKSIVVTDQNFETLAPSGLTKNGTGLTTSTATPTCATNKQKFVGLFENDQIKFTKSVLAHSKVSVSFDLYLAYSWDGLFEPTKPDRWKFCVGNCTSNADIKLDTSFSNVPYLNDVRNPTHPQSFPDSLASGLKHPAMTGSAARNTLGFYGGSQPCTGDPIDSTYTFNFEFDHADPTLILNFLAENLTVADREEKWGIDNLKVVISGDDTFDIFLPTLKR